MTMTAFMRDRRWARERAILLERISRLQAENERLRRQTATQAVPKAKGIRL